MKAAVLKALGSPLAVETVPDPVLGTGEVIVDVAATKVLAYAGEVFSGKRRYLLEPPVIPGAGCIGRVRRWDPTRPNSPPATGCSAIPPCARATMRRHRTSSCRA